MRSLHIMFSCCLAATIISPAFAAEPRTTGYVASAVIYPVSFEGKGLTPSLLHSVSLFVPMADRLSLVLKTGMATPITMFQPAPQLQIGVATKLSDGFALGATGIYRYVPHWSGTPGDSHVVGASVGPAILLPTKIALVFPVGIAHNLTTKLNSFSVAFELAFQIPL